MTTDEVLDLLVEVAAEVVSPRFRALSEDEVLEKRPGDLVTVADREAEVLITRALTAAYPDAVVLGEEAYAADPGLMDRFRGADHAFTVDPIDGTRNFVHGSPDHAVMVAETRAGETVRAWIWQPEHRVAWVAERGAGTWRDGVRMRTIRPADPARPAGVTSMLSWRGPVPGDLPDLTLSWVCCGVDYPRLVEGAADYIAYGTVLPWDHAPGTLLLAEAGGLARYADGSRYLPRTPGRGLLAAADAGTADLVAPRLASRFARLTAS